MAVIIDEVQNDNLSENELKQKLNLFFSLRETGKDKLGG